MNILFINNNILQYKINKKIPDKSPSENQRKVKSSSPTLKSSTQKAIPDLQWRLGLPPKSTHPLYPSPSPPSLVGPRFPNRCQCWVGLRSGRWRRTRIGKHGGDEVCRQGGGGNADGRARLPERLRQGRFPAAPPRIGLLLGYFPVSFFLFVCACPVFLHGLESLGGVGCATSLSVWCANRLDCFGLIVLLLCVVFAAFRLISVRKIACLVDGRLSMGRFAFAWSPFRDLCLSHSWILFFCIFFGDEFLLRLFLGRLVSMYGWRTRKCMT